MLKQYTKAQLAISERLAATKGEEGAAMVEYGLLVGLIAVVALAAVKIVGTDVDAVFGKIANAL